MLNDKAMPLHAAVANVWGSNPNPLMGAPDEDPEERKKKLMAAVGGTPSQYGDVTSPALLGLFK